MKKAFSPFFRHSSWKFEVSWDTSAFPQASQNTNTNKPLCKQKFLWNFLSQVKMGVWHPSSVFSIINREAASYQVSTDSLPVAHRVALAAFNNKLNHIFIFGQVSTTPMQKNNTKKKITLTCILACLEREDNVMLMFCSSSHNGTILYHHRGSIIHTSWLLNYRQLWRKIKNLPLPPKLCTSHCLHVWFALCTEWHRLLFSHHAAISRCSFFSFASRIN